jgi:4-hydroxy-tetrahydrodipicolinate reductase
MARATRPFKVAKRRRLHHEAGVTGISIFGASGRMGQAIAQAIEDRDDVKIAEHRPDVFVDFSVPEAVQEHVAAAVAAGKPILIGTTALTAEHHRLIDEAAATVAVIQAANTSLGVNLLVHLVREAASRLSPEWDVEIFEMHHRLKVDAPSGTALMLGKAAADGRGVDLGAVSDRGRDGVAGVRQPGHIGFASLRGGSVAGDHEVIFATEGERLELGHRAESRFIFARGAIEAALWLVGKPAGRYTMADVLGLKE